VSAEEDGESGIGAVGAPGEVVDRVESVFGGCCDDAGEHALGGSPDAGPVATLCFAVYDTGSHRLFASAEPVKPDETSGCLGVLW